MAKITFPIWISILFIGLLFLPIHVNNILVAGFIIATVITQKGKISWVIIKNDKLLLLLIIPFLVFGLSVFISEDLHEGWKMLEKKLCLFIFPFFIRIYTPTAKEKTSTLISLVLIFVAVAMMCLVYQTFLYFNDAGDSGLFYNDLLIGFLNMQAVYFSWYVTVFITITAWLCINKNLSARNAWLIIIFLFIVNILLASRIALLLSFIVLAVFLFYQVRNWLGPKKGVMVASLITASLFTSIFFFPQTFNRVKSIGNTEVDFTNTNPINHFNGEIKSENWNGLNVRLAIWTCAIDAIGKSPIVGFGIGDAENILRIEYEAKEFTFGLTNNFNTHNQYLDILLNAGIIGLILIVGAWCKVLLIAKKNTNQLLLIFLIITMLVMLTENILNRNQGVFFFSFFISLFSLFNFNKKALLV
jgi:O-antigen ligase